MAESTDIASNGYCARMDQWFEDKLLSDAGSSQGALEYLNWTLGNLDTKDKETRIRLASNNFRCKLYASVANITETI